MVIDILLKKIEKANNMKKQIIAIIPARKGSKRLPDKNKKPLLGKPLVFWTIDQAKKSKLIDRIVVDSDDVEILELADKMGVDCFIRPPELAKDSSSIYDVIFNELDYIKEKEGKEYDVIVLLEPTSPLRKDEDIDNAIQALLDDYQNTDSIVSVGEIQLEKPQLAMKFDGKNISFYNNQDVGERFFPYGVAYISKVEALRKNKSFYQEQTRPYFLERWQGYEVNDIYDLICIEAIMEKPCDFSL